MRPLEIVRAAVVLALWVASAPRTVAAADLLDITHSGSFYIAARDDGAVHRSTGGLGFATQSTGGATPLRGVAFLSNLFVAVGDGGRIVRSSNNGLTWSPETSNTSAHLREVVSHGMSLIAVGDGGTTLRRFGTATSWDTTLSVTTKPIHSVATNGLSPGILVAVGDDGLLLRSTDQGLTWSLQTLAGAPDLRGVCAGANAAYFVAVGRGGRVFRSTNFGVGWEDVSQPSVTADLYDVASDATNRFVAVGAGGTVLRSGVDAGAGGWIAIDTGLAGDLFGVHRDGTYYYAVGAGEVVARSLDGTTWLNVAVQSVHWSDVKRRYR
jgi:photosystem II stability/assembly factor-like uncharacterized protein